MVNLFLHPENHTIDSLCANLCSPSKVSHFHLKFHLEESKNRLRFFSIDKCAILFSTSDNECIKHMVDKVDVM